MIRKSGYRFSEKIMLKQKIERDDDSKKSHPALRVPTNPLAFTYWALLRGCLPRGGRATAASCQARES
jgi:hypothetical protein